MYDDIRNAHAELREALLGFNAQWPGQVVSGVAWRLPLLREQKAPDVISVERLTGNDAIQSAKAAFSMLERASGQAPGTVMRLPGYFEVRDCLLDQVRAINRLKDALVATVEQTRLEMNLPRRHAHGFCGRPRGWFFHDAGVSAYPGLRCGAPSSGVHMGRAYGRRREGSREGCP